MLVTSEYSCPPLIHGCRHTAEYQLANHIKSLCTILVILFSLLIFKYMATLKSTDIAEAYVRIIKVIKKKVDY